MALFLQGHERRKYGKTKTYWSLVENRRSAGGRVVQRHVLYLGRLTHAQELRKNGRKVRPARALGPSSPGLASQRELQRQEGRRHCGPSEGVSDRATAAMGCLLGRAYGLKFVAAIGFLAVACCPVARYPLAQRAHYTGDLPPLEYRQRMAAASAMV